jgi:hypothetical protein
MSDLLNDTTRAGGSGQQNANTVSIVPKIMGRLVNDYVPGTSFKTYRVILENNFVTHGITAEADKVAYLLASVGTACVDEILNALDGKLDGATCKDMLDILTRRFTPKKIVVSERHHFLSLKQKPFQSLNEYVAELRKAATTCDFDAIKSAKDAREAFMLQAFVKGLRSEQTRIKILQTENITLARAIELVGIYEEADNEGQAMGRQNAHHVRDTYRDRRHDTQHRGRSQQRDQHR